MKVASPWQESMLQKLFQVSAYEIKVKTRVRINILEEHKNGFDLAEHPCSLLLKRLRMVTPLGQSRNSNF